MKVAEMEASRRVDRISSMAGCLIGREARLDRPGVADGREAFGAKEWVV